MFQIAPIAPFDAPAPSPEDDHWGGTTAMIDLAPGVPPESLEGLAAFSHVEVIYVFDRVPPDKIVSDARHPRNNPAWPKAGIFAQRGKNRPNRPVCRSRAS